MLPDEQDGLTWNGWIGKEGSSLNYLNGPDPYQDIKLIAMDKCFALDFSQKYPLGLSDG